MNDMRQMTGLGRQIENSSFDVIDREVGPTILPKASGKSKKSYPRDADLNTNTSPIYQTTPFQVGYPPLKGLPL